MMPPVPVIECLKHLASKSTLLACYTCRVEGTLDHTHEVLHRLFQKLYGIA